MLLLVLTPQSTFNRLTYCREFASGLYEKQCIELQADGTGESRVKRRGSEEIRSAMMLSKTAQEKARALVAGTRNLADPQTYESKRKVANLGRKHITLEMSSETREAEFNYSDIKEVNALSTFFDALLNQETLVFDLDTAARYERLSIPERLDQLEGELRAGRIGDPEGLVPALDRLIQNDRILDYAREHAQQMKTQILLKQ